MRWLRRLYDWVLSWSESPHARPALFLLAFSEASFFPVPPDVLLMAMCLALPAACWTFAGIALAGSVLGGIGGYLIGYALWGAAAPFFFHYVPGFNADTFVTVRSLFAQYGFLAVFTAGFTPVPYKLITITAGIFQVSFPVFVVASVVSRGLRFLLVAGLLKRFGPPVRELIERYFNLFSLLLLLLLIGGFLLARHLM